MRLLLLCRCPLLRHLLRLLLRLDLLLCLSLLRKDARGTKAEVARPSPLTAEEAVVQATAEGLTLEPSSSATGYKGVTARPQSRYQADVKRGGKHVTLGTFDTPEEAALAVARAKARTTAPADRSCSPAAKGAALEPPPATHLNSDSDDGVETEEGEEGEEVKEVEEVNGIEVKET